MFHDNGLFGESLALMNELRHQGQLCDVTLKVEDQSFSAHRIILAGAIPYFHAMFTNNMAESRMEEVTMKGIVPGTLKCLISYAYTATVQIDKENVQNLFEGASFLQLDKVRDACADFLISHFDAHDVLCLRQLADSLDCNRLLEAADKYINRHFSEIADSQEFLLLTSDQLIEIIQRDDLNVRTEEVVFEACLRWVKHNREERSVQLPAVLSRVRLPMLTQVFLVDHVANERLVETSPECRKLVQEAINCHLFPERRQQLQSFRTQPRACKQVFVVGIKDEKTAKVDIFDPLTGELTQGLVLKVKELWAKRGAAVGGKMYLFDDNMLIYDFKKMKWSRHSFVTPLPSFSAVAVLDDDIYLCGGTFDSQHPSKTVSCFHTKPCGLKKVADMLQERESANAVSLDKFVYVLGGDLANSVLDSVERYDPARDIWENVKPMLNKRRDFGTAILNGKLYACGGHDGNSYLQSVEVYDPNTDTWNLVAPMNYQRSGPGLVSYANKLWFIGGKYLSGNRWGCIRCDDEERALNSVEVYDPKTNKWTFPTPMNVPKECIIAGVIPV